MKQRIFTKVQRPLELFIFFLSLASFSHAQEVLPPVQTPENYPYVNEMNAIRDSERTFLNLMRVKMTALHRISESWRAIGEAVRALKALPPPLQASDARSPVEKIAYERARVRVALMLLGAAKTQVQGHGATAQSSLAEVVSAELSQHHTDIQNQVNASIATMELELRRTVGSLDSMLNQWERVEQAERRGQRVSALEQERADLHFHEAAASFQASFERMHWAFNGAMDRRQEGDARSILSAFTWLHTNTVAALRTRVGSDTQMRSWEVLSNTAQRKLQQMVSRMVIPEYMKDSHRTAKAMAKGGDEEPTSSGGAEDSDGWSVDGNEENSCRADGDDGERFTHEGREYEARGASREIYVSEPTGYDGTGTDGPVMTSSSFELGGTVEIMPPGEVRQNIERAISESIIIDMSTGVVDRKVELHAVTSMLSGMRGLICGARDNASGNEAKWQLELLDAEVLRYAAMKGYFENAITAVLSQALVGIRQAEQVWSPEDPAMRPFIGPDLSVIRPSALTPDQMSIYDEALEIRRREVATEAMSLAVNGVVTIGGALPGGAPLAVAYEVLSAAYGLVCEGPQALKDPAAEKALEFLADALRDRLLRRYPH